MIRRVSYKLVLLLIAVLFSLPAYATHQKAAEMMVQYVSGYTYRVILITYTFTQSEVDRPQLEVFWGDGNSSVLDRSREEILENDTKVNYYTGEHTYSGPGMYQLYMEDPNRNSGVINVPNSVLTPMYISTTILISPWLEGNSSPVTTRRPVDDNACLGQPYVHNPAVYDPDGDSISYRLVPCRSTGGEDVPGYTYPAASDTFYIDPYRGDLVWRNPLAQGEYNVAFLIEEWRNSIKIGDVTRDMQIIVRVCDNNPPYIEAQDMVCVEEGQELRFPVWVRDQNDNKLSLEAAGEIMNGNYSAAVEIVESQLDSAVFEFIWKTSLGDARRNPYQLYLRATDDGDPVLSNVKTVMVHVLAPAPQWSSAQGVSEGIDLHWHPSLSPHAQGYILYRRDYSAEEVVTDSCTRGTGDPADVKVAQLSVSDTSFLDTQVKEGREYCYKVVAYFADGSESKASDPICVKTFNDAPLFTRVSVLETSTTKGRIGICWVRPEIYDTAKVDEYRYRLWGGNDPENLELIKEFPFDTAICYVDSFLNTSEMRYYYRLGLDTLPLSGEVDLSALQSDTVPQVFLTAVGRSQRVELSWYDHTPWRTLRYDIFRRDADVSGATSSLSGTWPVVSTEPGLSDGQVEGFVYVGSSPSGMLSYIDHEVEVLKDYEYYVRAVGSYGSDYLPDTLYNMSNRVVEQAILGEPCKPYLFLLDSRCEPLGNTLVWDFDSLYDPFGSLTQEGSMSEEEKADCEASVEYYEVYRKRATDDDFVQIATVEGREYEDNEAGSLYCQYQVVAVGPNGDVSPASNILHAENWDCFLFDLPNVFTPNADGVNDVWKARKYTDVGKFRIDVVNRWGVKVYTSTRPDFQWNGKLNGNGSDCPDGPYFYMAEFEAQAEGKVFRKVQSGSVTILR